MLDRWRKREFHWANLESLGRRRLIEDPDHGHLAAVLGIVDVPAISRRDFKVVLDACHGAGGRMGRSLLRALGCRSLVVGGEPDGRYDHAPEPTEANLHEFGALVPAVGAAVGFAQDPDADRLAIVDEKGRYIGEELTLALAATRRLGQEKGPVILNLSTSRVTETLARAAGCAVFRTPVGEINVAQRMVDVNALLGGEGNGGVIDPRVGYVRDSFVGMAHRPGLDGRHRPAAVKPRGRPAALCDGQGTIPASCGLEPRRPRTAMGRQRSRHSGTGSPTRGLLHVPIAATGSGWIGMTAGFTCGPATPSRSCGVIAEAAELLQARELAAQVGHFVGKGTEATP